MRHWLATVALGSSLLLGAVSPVRAAQIRLHADYFDQLHMEWQFSSAAIVTSVGQYYNAPKGGAILLLFASVRNVGSSVSYYGVGSFAAGASPSGRPFDVYITGKYYPQLSGGKLRPKESTRGWFAFRIPAHIRKAYVRVNNAFDPNADKVLFTVPIHR